MKTLSCERIAQRIAFDRKLFQKILISTFLVGFLTHGFCYFNLMYSHDSLAAINQNTTIYWKLGIGRFMQLVNIYLRGPMVLPWVIGALSLVWLSVAIYFMVRLFDFKTDTAVYAVVLLLTTNISLTLTNATFIHEADSFMLALLFAVLSVYLFDQFKYGWCVAPCFIVVACGFYQAYLSAAVVLFMLVLIRDILRNMPGVAVLKKSIAAVLVLLAGTALYYLTYQAILLVLGINPLEGTYNEVSSATQMLSFDLVGLFCSNYSKFFSYLSTSYAFNAAPTLIANAVFILVTLFLFVRYYRQQKMSLANIGLLLLILLALQQGFGVLVFLSDGFLCELMMFSYAFVYFIPLLLLQYTKRDTVLSVAVFFLIVILAFQNYIYANTAYLKKELAYERTQSAVTRVLSQIEGIEGYMQGETPVAIVGIFASDYDIIKLDELTGRSMEYDYAISRDETLRSYFSYILAYDINYLAEEEIAEIAATQAVQEMPSYPDNGYCQEIDGVIVVKLSGD